MEQEGWISNKKILSVNAFQSLEIRTSSSSSLTQVLSLLIEGQQDGELASGDSGCVT